MKKQKMIYRTIRYDGKVLHAKREISYEIKLSTRLLLDELCFIKNKDMLEDKINRSIDEGDELTFKKLSKQYKQYIRF